MNRKKRCCRGHGRPGRCRSMSIREPSSLSSTPGSDDTCPGSDLISSTCNMLLVMTLIGASYFLIAYHCNQCSRTPDVHLRQNINDLSLILKRMQKNYEDIEQKIQYLSAEVPSIKLQMESLEKLANLIKSHDTVYKRELIPLPSYLIKSDGISGETHLNDECRFQCPSCWHFE